MMYQQLDRNNSSLDQKDQGDRESRTKEGDRGINTLSNEDRLFNSVKARKKPEIPTLRLTVAEDVRATFLKSQAGSDQGMDCGGAYQSQQYHRTHHLPRLGALGNIHPVQQQSKTANCFNPNSTSNNNDLITVSAAQVHHIGLQGVIKLHSDLQKQEIENKSNLVVSQTINLRRTTTPAFPAGNLTMQSPQLNPNQRNPSKGSITTKNQMRTNSKGSKQPTTEHLGVSNFTLKFHQAKLQSMNEKFHSHQELEEISSDDGHQINKHHSSDFKRNSTGGKSYSKKKREMSQHAHNDSNFNDRQSEGYHSGRSKSKIILKNYDKPAVPLLMAIDSPTNEDSTFENVEEFNVGTMAQNNMRQIQFLRNFTQPKNSNNSMTPLVYKQFKSNLNSNKEMCVLKKVGKSLQFGREEFQAQDLPPESIVTPFIEPIVLNRSEQQSERTQEFQNFQAPPSQKNTIAHVRIEDAEREIASKQSSPLPHFGVKSDSVIESPIKFEGLKQLNQNSPNLPTFRKLKVSQLSNMSFLNIGESLDNINIGTGTNRARIENRFEEIRVMKKRAQIIEKAIILFNSGKFLEAIDYLIKIEALPRDQEQFFQATHINDAQAIEFAKFLYQQEGLDKNMIGEFLGRDKDISNRTNYAFFSLFPFQNLVMDVAMRGIFKKIRLPKESQQIERIIRAFSQGYWLQNQQSLLEHSPNWSNDNVEFMALSVLVLNTTYHSDKIPKALKLSKENFIKTNYSVLKDIFKENDTLMSDMYDRIAKKQFEAKIELQEKFFRRVNDQAVDYLPSESYLTELLKSKGTVFTKYGRLGVPHKRLVQLNDSETKIEWKDPLKPLEQPRFINCNDITQVLIGSDHTKVMQKQKIPLEFDSQCFSIITLRRTLDLRIDDLKAFQVWIDKIRLIIRNNEESNNRDLLENQKQKNEEKFQKDQLLESIWRAEILINWEKYWDPLKKQLKGTHHQHQMSLKDRQKVFAQFEGLCQKIEENEDCNFKMEKSKLQSELSNQITERLDQLWFEGLPTFARVCLWPFLLQNTLSLSPQIYQSLKQDFYKQKLQHLSSLEAPQLSMYLTGAVVNINKNGGLMEMLKYNGEEAEQTGFASQGAPQMFERVEKKVHKYCQNNIKLIDEHGIEQEWLQDLICNVVGSFCLYRPDIGFISGLEKIVAQFGMVFWPRFNPEDNTDQVLEQLEFQIFSMMANLTQSKDRHISTFLMSDSDEISWRLDYFDKIFERELPQLSLHFKAINLQSQLYLYDWLLSLYTCVLPPSLIWRIWDQYLLRGELFLYQVALGLLRYKQPSLLGQPLNQCIQVFKSLRTAADKPNILDEDLLFESISQVICVSKREFDEYRETQMRAEQKASIFKVIMM